jgi:hypothetical protein
MAYKPTDTYIPCTTNGFIDAAYSKSYKFSITKPTKYPGEETVNGVIWIVDIEAMSKGDLASAQQLAGKNYDKDPTGNTYYPFVNNYYAFSNLYDFPEKNPKDGSDLHDPWNTIETSNGIKRFRDDLGTSLKRVEYGEITAQYSLDDFINLAKSYLENSYKNIVYGRKKDPIWVDAAKRSDAGEITREETTRIYDEIGNRAENKMSLTIDGDEPVVEEVYTGKYISASAFSTPTVPIEITFDILKGEKLIESIKNSSGFVFEETNKQIYFLASGYFYDANGKWLERYGVTIIPKDTKIEITGYPFPESPDPAGMSASGVDNGSPSGKPTTNPVMTVGKFTLKVKSGPGVIIGVTEVEISGGKADFSGIQFDQPGDYVVTVGSTSPDVEPTEIKFKVLPEPTVIPQESKGVTESNASGTRPIITQIDRPTIEVKPMEFERQGTDKGGSVQVATTIGLTPFLSIGGSQINDRDIISFSLYHEGMIPKVDILFRDTNGMISKQPPRDDTKFDIFLNSRSVNLKCIHLIFKIEEFGRMEAGQYSLSGTLDVSDLYRNKFKVRRGTSFEVLREICKDLKIGFNSNIENTTDTMPWRNVGDKEYKFMEDIIKHSYISEESFMAGYIDFYYCFNYVDIEKEMKRDITNDVGIDTGGIDKPGEKDADKIKSLKLTSEKGQQTSSMYFSKKAERNESTKISMEQGYRTRTKFYDTVKKMFLVFDVDSTTSDGSKSHILKGSEGDKESFDNNYVTKYHGKIDTDNVHKNHNYAVTQNKINLDNMMKNQMDISLPNPNFNLYRFQKIQVFLMKDAATVAAPETIQWRYSGEWMIASIKYTFLNGTLSQEITLARKEMGKDPAEIKEGTNNGTKEKKEEKNENPIVGSASSTITYKPNEKYKVGDIFTVQDSSGKKYILTINKLSENGIDVVTSLKDPFAIPNQTLTSPDTITGVSQSTVADAVPETIVATASGVYRHEVKLELAWGGIDGDYTQARVSDVTNNHAQLTSSGNLISAEDNIKDSKSLFIAIKRPFPTYKPSEDWQKALTPFNWTVFELSDQGINDFFTNDVVISPYSNNNSYNILDSGNPKVYESLKYRIFNGQEKWGHLKENGEKLWGFDAWTVPKGSISILDSDGNVVKEFGDTNNSTTTTAQVKGGFAGTPPKYEYSRWFAYPGDGSPTASVLVTPDQEYTPVGGENTLYYDMTTGFKPGVYTLEVKYYVPLYVKINHDGENAGKPYNGTGMWEVEKQRLMTKDPVTNHNPYELKTLKATFNIVKKSQKK